MEEACAAVQGKGSSLPNVWGFVDGIFRRICHPRNGQRLFYNGHKGIHGLKFQSVITPFGIVVHLYGPVEGIRHDASMLCESGLLDNLQQSMQQTSNGVYSLYGDPAYPLSPYLLAPFGGATIMPAKAQFNQSMSAVCVTVEWAIGTGLFPFIDFRKNLKVLLQPVGLYYIIATRLSNCHTCIQIASFVNLVPPICSKCDVYSYAYMYTMTECIMLVTFIQCLRNKRTSYVIYMTTVMQCPVSNK